MGPCETFVGPSSKRYYRRLLHLTSSAPAYYRPPPPWQRGASLQYYVNNALSPGILLHCVSLFVLCQYARREVSVIHKE